MPLNNDALAIETGDSDQRFALAANTLATGASVAMFDGALILRARCGELVCEVVDPTPSARRCANEYEVLVENAQRALESSKLDALLPRIRRRWVVVGDTGAHKTELWRAT
ncbi:MAG: hypothetical protein ABI640_16375 [Gammaproteobacteria bacterium]